jgi:oligoendopeptidase F
MVCEVDKKYSYEDALDPVCMALTPPGAEYLRKYDATVHA